MSLENHEHDLAAFKAVLEDFVNGKLKLQDGQEEFLADLKQRIFSLEQKLGRRAAA